MTERTWAQAKFKTPASRGKLAKDILHLWGKRRAAIGVFLVANSKLRGWKRRYLGLRPKEVDVLSFPAPSFPGGARAGELGEVYLNRTIVRREPERGVRLLIHGTAHLLGFSHRGKRDTIKMQSKEKQIFDRLFRES